MRKCKNKCVFVCFDCRRSMKGAVSKTSPINELSMPVVDKERETNE